MMNLTVIAVGKLNAAYYRQAAAEYEKRLGAFCRVHAVSYTHLSMVVDAIETGNFSNIGNAPFKQGNGPPYVVAVDAGHGGQDLGAEGIYTEVNVTEATANALISLPVSYTHLKGWI